MPQQSIKTIHPLVPLLILALAAAVLTLPVLLRGVPFLSSDGITHHAVWYLNFSQQFWAGDLYPRWLMNMNAGLGSPAFFYYPPIPYYLTSLLKPFFAWDANGWRQLGFSAYLALVASGAGAYFWLREFTPRGSALLGGVLYMAMPYHLAADLYIRGAIAEYWGFLWLPLILLFTQRARSGHRMYLIGLAITYAGLIMTHLPTALIFSWVPVCYVLACSQASQRIRNLKFVMCGMALGAGLAAIYLIPAIATQGSVLLGRNTTGYYSFENWLLFAPQSLWSQDRPGMILLVIDMVALAGLSFVVLTYNPEKRIRVLGRFWIGVAVLSTLMMTNLSRPVWLILPPLQQIQFTWRFNIILTLAAVALATMAFARFEHSKPRAVRLSRALMIVAILAWIPGTIWAARQSFPETHPDPALISENDEIIKESRDAPEYWPSSSASMAAIDWNRSRNIERWDGFLNERFRSLLERVYRGRVALPRVRELDGEGVAGINVWKPRDISLHVSSAKGVMLEVSQFYFPGWSARIAGDETLLPVTASQPDGLLDVLVPAGDHEVTLRLERSGTELAGEIVSLLSLVVTLALVAKTYYKVEGGNGISIP